MKPETKCIRCGAEIVADAPEGLCPRCLLAAGLNPQDSAETRLDATASTEAEDPHREAPPKSPDSNLVDPILPERPAEGPVEPGNKLKYFGDYEILEKIAQGGMGVVYKARQLSLNRLVAVKMILTGPMAGETEIKRFQQEAEAAANLQHPNIVAIHEVGEHEGRHYFSMDFVDGQSLALMTKEGPMAAPRAAELVKTLAEAIQFAHQRGILHRDLKPHNVLIDSRGIPRITDFGLAKQVNQDSSLTMEGALMGTPSYMSPEQAAGRHDLLGPGSDVYSLGAILYELLTGQPPFRGKTPMETVRQVIDREPATPSKLNSKVPGDLETICRKCLEKKPDHRYSSARMLAEELGRFLSHEPILARPASGFRKAGAWAQRHPWVITAALALMVLGVSGLAFGFWDKSRYLEWLQTHPPRKKTKEGAWFIISTLTMGLTSFLVAPFVFLDFVDRKRRGFPLFAPHLRIYAIFGIVTLAISINFSISLVHAWVWKAGEGLWLLCFGFPGAWFGALLLWHVIRESRSLQFGVERPETAVLFPPKPKESWKTPPPTLGGRKAFNIVALTVLFAESLLMLVEGLVSSGVEAARFFKIIANTAGEAWLVFFWWRNTRTASKHVILFFGAMLLLQALAFAATDPHQDLYRLRGSQWMALGMGLLLGWVIEQVFKRAKVVKANDPALETADFSWVKAHRGLSLMAVGIAFVPLVLTARFWSSFAQENSPHFLAYLSFVLVLESARYLRAAGPERKARGHSILVWLLGCILASQGLSLAQESREIAAGALLGCALVAFFAWKSKGR